MAYRTRRRASSRRAPARGSYRAPRRRSTARRSYGRRTSTRPQSLTIRVVQEVASPVSRPDIIGLKPAPAPHKRKF